MRGSDPLHHDPAAQNKTFRDLTVGVGCGSGGQGFSWASAAAERAGGGFPRRRVGELAGDGRNRPSWGQIDGFLGREDSTHHA